MHVAEGRSLFQEHVDRRVGNAQFPTGTGLVAAVAGRGAAGCFHADDRLRLGERARSLVRFGVEQKPLSTDAEDSLFDHPRPWTCSEMVDAAADARAVEKRIIVVIGVRIIKICVVRAVVIAVVGADVRHP
jgi:hypothetical protein